LQGEQIPIDGAPPNPRGAKAEDKPKGTGRQAFFIRQHGCEGDSGMIIDGDIQELPAGDAQIEQEK
jgi:hypothetical protein